MDLHAALALANGVLAEHGLHDWSVGLDRAVRRAGACHFGPRVISLSRQVTVLHDEAEVRETVLHEVAHALVGPGHGHDETWRRQALAIGSTGERCVSEDAPKVDGVLRGRCAAGHEVTAHKRPERVKACAACTGPAHERLLSWTWHDVDVRMHPRYVAQLVQLAERHGGQAQEQLDLDALLGGGAARPMVAALQQARLRPGTRVRLGGRLAGTEATVQSFGRSRYAVRTDDGRGFTVPPHLLEPVLPGPGSAP